MQEGEREREREREGEKIDGPHQWDAAQQESPAWILRRRREEERKPACLRGREGGVEISSIFFFISVIFFLF